MKSKQVGSVLFLAATAAMTLSAFAQSSSSLVSSWLVTVEGESRTRTLIIAEEAATSNGAILKATYGMSDEKQGPVPADVQGVGNKRQLSLTTQAGTKIVAIEQPDGTFQGTFSLKTGVTKVVTIARVSGETPPITAQTIRLPGADVPLACAEFFGVWSGSWPNVGRSWLRVANVDSTCTVKYTYGLSAVPPKAYRTARIEAGVLNMQRTDGGFTTFKIEGNRMAAFYKGPSGENSATLQRFRPDDPVAALKQERLDQ